MKNRLYFLFLLLICSIRTSAQNEWKYYFEQPASIWEESIPLGNGRIGMMPWGGIDQERVVLNEISLWAGRVQDADNPEAYKYLGEIRRLLFEKKNKEAQDLMYKTFTCLGGGSTDNSAYGNYQVFGNLFIDSKYSDPSTAITNYRRELNLNDAISTTTYTRGKTNYKREYFTSFTDDIGIIKYSADKKKSLSLNIYLNRDERFETAASGNMLYIFGEMNAGEGNKGMKYLGMVKVENKGGTMFTTADRIEINNADEVTIRISLATDYQNKDVNRVASDLLNNANKNYNKAKKDHIEDYQRLFNRVDLSLEKNKNSDLPIDKRLDAFEKDNTDHDLAALYMQYGRYLLISSTRVGGLPPNLQGLWAPQVQTPWNGDYHLNINLQMNLWGAETGNLSELHKPLIEYTRSLVEPGSKTAKIYYNSRGWVTHILGNIWGFTSPSEDPSWGATNTAGAWLCQHLWQHYLYINDVEYLRYVYPVMKGAALFFDDMLIEDPNNGYLVTAPTTSPENQYITTEGDKLSICAGSTMDNQIVRELFGNTIKASEILGLDREWAQSLAVKSAKLAPTSIGKHGQIMEWIEDYDEAEIHHRHVSQLYGLYPGNEITYEATPKLMQAAKATLNRRGDQSTGWSMAWKINFWARLKDGERTYKLVSDLLKPARDSWGTYPNLFSSHPPMQIDGNFGGSAGIMEMLLQSHAGYIELLPSVPQQWKEGNVQGLKARGGAEVSFSWKNNSIDSISITSDVKNSFVLKLPKGEPKISGITAYEIKDGKLYFDLSPQKNIKIELAN